MINGRLAVQAYYIDNEPSSEYDLEFFPDGTTGPTTSSLPVETIAPSFVHQKGVYIAMFVENGDAFVVASHCNGSRATDSDEFTKAFFMPSLSSPILPFTGAIGHIYDIDGSGC